MGAFVAIAVAKMTFGGLGKNPFNPALVGRVFLLIAYPVQMTTWPLPVNGSFDVLSGATPLAAVKQGLAGPGAIGVQEMLLGNIPGSLGEVAAAALLCGFVYLLWRRVITWHIPVTVLATMAVFAGVVAMCSVSFDALPQAADGLFDLADDRSGRRDLRRGNRTDHHVHPSVGRLSRGHVVCDPDYERLRAPDQQICQTQALRREIRGGDSMKSTLLNMTAVLFGITLVASAGVGFVNMITVEPIAAAKEAATLAALNEVLPAFDVTTTEELTIDDMPITVYTATAGGSVSGYAVQSMTKQGFGGVVRLMVGFTPEGEVVNVNVLEQTETPGLGTKMADEGNVLLASVKGRKLESKKLVDGKLAVTKDGGDVDALTAATISSRAYVDAINRAWMAYKSVATGEAPTDTASGATAAAGQNNEPAAQEGGQNE